MLLRWIYIGRLSIASAIFIAAVLVWTRADADKFNLLIASLAFAMTTIVTVASVAYSEIYRQPLRSNFLYLQSIFDTLLVTSVVHVTSGVTSSPFAALYIVIIATSTLLLPLGGGILIAALGNVLYVADVIWAADTAMTVAVWLQLGVFVAVALTVGYVSVLLRREGEGKAILVAELQQLRLQAEDILRNIRSGVLTVDSEGRLLYANPTAEQMLGLNLMEQLGQPVIGEIARVAPELAEAVRALRARPRAHDARRRHDRHGREAIPHRRDDDVHRRRRPAHRPHGYGDLPGHLRSEAHGDAASRAERLEGIAELSASLAHEIKNPLASIRSAVEQLSRIAAVSGRSANALSPRDARVGPALAPPLRVPRLRARARGAHGAAGPGGVSRRGDARVVPPRSRRTVRFACLPRSE